MRTWLLDEYKSTMAKYHAIESDDEFRSEHWRVGVAINELYDKLTLGEREYLAHYYKCLEEGTSEKLADMFAAQAPPGGVTDCTFLANYRDARMDVTPFVEKQRREVAERLGQNTTGKVYVSQLAAFPGDPRAWVDGRGDIERVCRERGMGCEGVVNIPTPDMGRLPGRKRKPLAQKLHEAGLPIAGD